MILPLSNSLGTRGQEDKVHLSQMGSACGAAGSVVASNTRDPGLNPAVGKFICSAILYIILCPLGSKDKHLEKEKRPVLFI